MYAGQNTERKEIKILFGQAFWDIIKKILQAGGNTWNIISSIPPWERFRYR